MSFWDGEQWVAEEPTGSAPKKHPAFAGGAFIPEEVRLPPAPVLVAIVGIIIAIAVGTGFEIQAAGAVAGIAALWVSFRWPLLPLFAYAMLIPIEEVVVLGDLGTLSRLAAILFILAYGLPRLRRLRIEAMPIAAWGYVAWAVLSIGWAVDRKVAIAEVPILISLFLTAVVVAAAVVERPSIVRPLLWAYSLSAAVTAVVGLAKYFSGGTPTGTNDRVAALQGQSVAYFAAYLLPALIFCIFELVENRRVIVSAAIALASAAAILVSGTRAAWLSVGLVVATLVLPRIRPGRRIAAVGIALALGVIALQIPGLSKVVLERAAIAVSSGGAGRTDIWTVGLTIYETAPLSGVGIGNFPVAYTPELVRQSNVGVYSANNPAGRAPHNIVIGTLGELGPIGFGLLILTILPLVFRRGWGPDAAVVQAALAGLMAMSFFLDLLNRKQLWLLIGLAAGLTYLVHHRHVVQRAARTVRRPARKRKFSGIAGGDEPPVTA